MWNRPSAFDLGARGERGDQIDDGGSIAPVADEGVDDLGGLLAAVGLRDQEVLELDAEPAGVVGVERVLGVDEGAHAARALGLGDRVQGQRGLAR
jgi:hypothetical protein